MPEVPEKPDATWEDYDEDVFAELRDGDKITDADVLARVAALLLMAWRFDKELKGRDKGRLSGRKRR